MKYSFASTVTGIDIDIDRVTQGWEIPEEQLGIRLQLSNLEHLPETKSCHNRTDTGAGSYEFNSAIQHAEDNYRIVPSAGFSKRAVNPACAKWWSGVSALVTPCWRMTIKLRQSHKLQSSSVRAANNSGDGCGLHNALYLIAAHDRIDWAIV